MHWLVEQGIGEERALLVDGEHAIAAHVRWPGALETGQVADAVLVSRPRGSTRGRARFASGEEALVDRLPASASEGATMRLVVTRPSIGETGRIKLSHARPTDDVLRAAPSLAEILQASTVPRFPRDLWEEVSDEAREGLHEFPGGSLHFSATPAMTLVDVDGTLAPRELALAAAEALGVAIPRMGLGGTIGIDFPTLATKADRQEVDQVLASALADWPHERTSMNGFGFVQLVARLERPSLLHRWQHQPAAAAARLLMRRAEEVPPPGPVLLTAHPAVLAKIQPEWLIELGRRTGREIRQQGDPALALAAAFAQATAP